MKRSSVRPSVRLFVRSSVCPIDRQQQRHAAGLLLNAQWPGVDWRYRSKAGDGAQQQMRAVSR